MISEKEAIQAANALVAWFKSQDLQPGDAAIVMLGVIASQFVHKTRDVVELQKAISLHNVALSMNVAALLRDNK